MTFHEQEGTLTYKGKDGDIEFSAGEFIAGITQHIPDKSFQMVRYYGRYSNRMRVDIKKKGLNTQASTETPKDSVELIDVSGYSPKKVTSRTWRECIKKIWSDPLVCPKCQGEMKIISFITRPRQRVRSHHIMRRYMSLLMTVGRKTKNHRFSTISCSCTKKITPAHGVGLYIFIRFCLMFLVF